MVLEKLVMHVPLVGDHWAEAEAELEQDFGLQLLALGSFLGVIVVLQVIKVLNGLESL